MVKGMEIKAMRDSVWGSKWRLGLQSELTALPYTVRSC